VFLFREEHVERLIAVVSVILAALLLVGSIVALYFVQAPGLRLGLLGVFTSLFAASVALLTNAKRAELFAATATYVPEIFFSANQVLTQG
jgi:hypothetical protein